MKLSTSVRYPTDEMVPFGDMSVPAVWVLKQRDEAGWWPGIEARIELRQGRPELRALKITAPAQGMEVTASHLRGLSVENLIEAAANLTGQNAVLWSGQGPRETEGTVTVDDMVNAEAAARRASTAARRRPSVVTDDLLLEVAQTYRAAKTAPVEAVRRRTGKSLRTATNYVRLARERGFLDEEI